MMLGGVRMAFLDLDAEYKKVAHKVVLVNDFNPNDDKERAVIDNFLTNNFIDGEIDNTPRCNCIEIPGDPSTKPLVGKLYEGHICPRCHAVVSSALGRPVESELWVKVPKLVDAFIAPRMYVVLCDMFSGVVGLEAIRWLIDPKYQPSKKKLSSCNKTKRFIESFRSINWKRSLNHFKANFDLAIDMLIELDCANTIDRLDGSPRGKSPKQTAIYMSELKAFIQENKQYIFSEYLPMVSRCMLVTEQSNGIKSKDTVVYAISAVGLAMGAINTLRSVGVSGNDSKILHNSKALVIMDQINAFIDNMSSKLMSAKTGVYRRHINGGRWEFTMREVISSRTDVHDMCTIETPWRASLNLFKEHIRNILVKRYGFTPNAATNHIHVHMQKWCPIISEIFNILLKESFTGNNTIPCILNRNPTLKLGGTQLLGISKIKDDVSDNTISMSVMITAEPNADYDGDEMNLAVLVSKWEWLAFKVMRPSNTMMHVHQPYRLSTAAGALNKQIVRIWDNFIERGRRIDYARGN